jgi:hypothetical protein
MINEMYVFIGVGSNFPAGIFTTLDNAKEWIEKYSLSGILNKYPIDMGVYDWAVKEEFFSIKENTKKNLHLFKPLHVHQWNIFILKMVN